MRYDKGMDEGKEKSLTSEPDIIPTFKDAFGKFNLKVRWTARHLQHGRIEIAATLQVVNGVITQCDTKQIQPFERFRANSN